MLNRRIILEFEYNPDSQDFQKLLSLAKKLNATITDIPGPSLNNAWEPLHVGVSQSPENIDDLAVKEDDLEQLIGLFSNEPSAEDLCKML